MKARHESCCNEQQAEKGPDIIPFPAKTEGFQPRLECYSFTGSTSPLSWLHEVKSQWEIKSANNSALGFIVNT